MHNIADDSDDIADNIETNADISAVNLYIARMDRIPTPSRYFHRLQECTIFLCIDELMKFVCIQHQEARNSSISAVVDHPYCFFSLSAST